MSEVKQITWEDLKPRRKELGLTLPQIARRCGIDEWSFLDMIEHGEIRTTSSAIMACVAKGYRFDLKRCVGMVAHWSPVWPIERFTGEGKTENKPRKRQGRNGSLRYSPHQIAIKMEERRLEYKNIRHRTKGRIEQRTLGDILTGIKSSITKMQLAALCEALECEPWEISPDVEKPKEHEQGGGGIA